MHKQHFPYLLPLFGMCILFLMQSVFQLPGDFSGYYFGSRFVTEGTFTADTIYDTYTFNKQIAALGYSTIFVSYTPFPPFTSILFLPLTLFDLSEAKLIFNCFSVSVFLFSIIRLRGFLKLSPLFYLMVAIVFYIPIRSNIYLGQVYLLLFSLLIEGFILYKKEKHAYAACLWALAIIFKVFPLIGLFFLILKKEWKQLLYVSIAIAFLFGISIWLNRYEVWRVYLVEIFPRLSNGELNDAFTTQFQSMYMLLKNMFVYDAVCNPNALQNNPVLLNVLFTLFKIGVFSFCAFAVYKNNNGNGRDLAALGLWLLAGILISPNGSSYSQVILLFVFAAMLQSGFTNRNKIIFGALIFLTCNIPVHYFSKLQFLLQFPRLYLILTLFILLIAFHGIQFNYKTLLVLTGIFSILLLPNLKKQESFNDNYFFNDNRYMIIGDYGVNGNKLWLSYLNDNTGIKTDSFPINFSSITDKSLIIKNNQLYYKDKQLTFTNDNKKNPLLTSYGTALYLSDKNRGIGFYAIRQIPLPLAR